MGYICTIIDFRYLTYPHQIIPITDLDYGQNPDYGSGLHGSGLQIQIQIKDSDY